MGSDKKYSEFNDLIMSRCLETPYTHCKQCTNLIGMFMYQIQVKVYKFVPRPCGVGKSLTYSAWPRNKSKVKVNIFSYCLLSEYGLQLFHCM